MGFSSLDALTNEITVNNHFLRADFSKSFNGGTVIAGRWYDLDSFDGTNSMATVIGTYVKNGNFLAGYTGWTATSGFTYTPATHLMTKGSVATVDTLSQTTACSAGVTYNVTFTLGAYAGSGGVSAVLGGNSGTARSANNTYTENIVCGAGANAPIAITFPTTVTAATVDLVYIRRALAFEPCSDVLSEQALWHGGNVSPATKHIINVGVVGSTATSVPSVLMLVDVLGVYTLIQTNSNTAQILFNNKTLPRYTDGAGVRAFFDIDVTNGANAQNFVMTYTNSAGVSGRSLGAVVSNTASAIASHISHSGVAAGNTGGPFLPLMGGDVGIRSVQSVQFSAASASAGFINLVLCKPLVSIPLTTAFVTTERDLLTQLPSLPQVQDGACIQFLHYAGAVTAAATQWQGYIDFAWGNS